MKEVRWIGLVFVVVLLLAPAAWAQSESKDDDSEENEPLSEYVKVAAPDQPTSNSVATKLPTEVRWIPANVGTVGPALIEEQSASTISDALRNVSGLNIQAQNGVQDFFVVRGFDSLSGSLILTDGVGEPEATVYPLYNVEAVEVLKGPGGFLYGKDPLSGAVNIVRKQPLPVDLLGAQVRAGSFGMDEISVDWNESVNDDHAFRLNAFRTTTDNYRSIPESEHYGFNPGYRWTINGHSALNVNLEIVSAEFAPDAGIPLYNGDVAPVDPRTSYASPFDHSEQDVLRLQVDYENQISDSVTLRNKFYVRTLDWQSAGTLINGAFDVPLGGGASIALVSRALTTLDSEQQFVGNQFEAVMQFETGPVTHNLLTGLEVAQQTDESSLSFGMLPEIGVFDPVESATMTPMLFPFFAADAETQIVAPYVVDQIQFGQRCQVLIGGRYDNIDYEDPLSATDRDDSKFSPMFGFVYSPQPSLSVYANNGRSFAPPGSRVVGEREPERSIQTEIGVKKTFADGRVQATWAYYDIERENIAIPDSTGVLQTTGDQKSSGFEFEIAAISKRGVRTVFSYANNDSELTEFSERIQTGPNPATDFIVVDRSGNRPSFTPRHLLNLWSSKQFEGGFGLGAGARLIDDQFISEDNSYTIDQAIIWDAKFWYEFDKFDVQLGIENIGQEQYAVRGFGNVAVIPADGRSAYIGVGIKM
ncbi:MAG: TonB-dependent siderophore receptor [Acidobacteriota bacterium]|nr:TonB-dependent siderophore receptor [Acidobacteriota bacterium]